MEKKELLIDMTAEESAMDIENIAVVVLMYIELCELNYNRTILREYDYRGINFETVMLQINALTE